jgi:hypothetical protein
MVPNFVVTTQGISVGFAPSGLRARASRDDENLGLTTVAAILPDRTARP